MLGSPRVLLVSLALLGDGATLMARARELARRFDAKIVLFHCVRNQYVSRRYFRDEKALAHARQSLVEEHRKRLERVARRETGDGLSVIVDTAWDAPWDEATIRAAHRHGADWILVELEHHPIHRLPFLAAAHWQLVRHSPCPLLLVRPGEWSSPPRVVAAVDPLHRHGKPEDLDRRILEAGASVCARGGGELYVFHAFEPILGALKGEGLEPLSAEFAEATLEGAHNAAVEGLLEGLRERVSSVRIAEGRPEDKLADFAEEIGADMVVMGAVARNALQRIFVGSTAEKVLERLSCDVLLIKPESFRGPVATTPLDEQPQAGPG